MSFVVWYLYGKLDFHFKILYLKLIWCPNCQGSGIPQLKNRVTGNEWKSENKKKKKKRVM